jgi:Fur family peroxide stress response transcriptional regulator
MKRNTKQRSTILENLKGRCDHPTAEMVYDSVREEIPNISLGTVYRNLRDLSDTGDILAFEENDTWHFDGTSEPHMHFCCRSCGRIDDLMIDGNNLLLRDGFEVKNIIVEGICRECQENGRK